MSGTICPDCLGHGKRWYVTGCRIHCLADPKTPIRDSGHVVTLHHEQVMCPPCRFCGGSGVTRDHEEDHTR